MCQKRRVLILTRNDVKRGEVIFKKINSIFLFPQMGRMEKKNRNIDLGKNISKNISAQKFEKL